MALSKSKQRVHRGLGISVCLASLWGKHHFPIPNPCGPVEEAKEPPSIPSLLLYPGVGPGQLDFYTEFLHFSGYRDQLRKSMNPRWANYSFP